MNIKGVIFDVDGVLLDSMQMWVSVERGFLVKRGKTPPPDFYEFVRTLSSEERGEYLRVEYGVHETTEEINKQINVVVEEFYSSEVGLKAGVLSVFETLRNRGIKMCAATATDRYLVESALRRCGVLGYLERLFTCNEEDTSKKEPDIFIRAAEFIGTEISETLVVEDALYAIKTAKAAGFQVAGVFDPVSAELQSNIKARSDYYLSRLDDILRFLV
jgi:HAD superfamily hydrolase (TIGR01509 family)